MRCIEFLLWSGMMLRVLCALIHLHANYWNRYLYCVFRRENECWNEFKSLANDRVKGALKEFSSNWMKIACKWQRLEMGCHIESGPGRMDKMVVEGQCWTGAFRKGENSTWQPQGNEGSCGQSLKVKIWKGREKDPEHWWSFGADRKR